MDFALTALLLSLVMAVAFRYFMLYDKSFVWNFDGLAQHYPALHVFNTWVRGMARNPELGVPLWSWDMGLGADMIGTLAFPVILDPFALISLLFPMTHLETAYAVMLLVRTLCAGLAATAYLRVMGARALPSAIGAIIYLFTTFLLVQSRHPYFINGMVFLPLLLIGVECVLRRRKAHLLTLFVFLAGIANFYFFYILTIVTVVYSVVRYFDITPSERRWKCLVSAGGRIAGYYAVGALLAAPLLLSAAAAVLQTARAQSEFQMGFLYTLREYASMVAALGSSQAGAHSTFLGFAYPGLLLALVLFLRRRAHSGLKFMLALYVPLIGLPIFGSAFNGFTFPSNRFAFTWGIFIALAAALVLSEGRVFTRREIAVMCSGLVVYGVTVLLTQERADAQIVLPMTIGALTIGVFALERLRVIGASQDWLRAVPRLLPGEWRAPLSRWSVVGLLIANVAINGMFLHSSTYDGTVAEYVDRGDVLQKYQENPGSLTQRLPRDHFYRVNNSDTLFYNSSMVQGFPSTSFYFSTMNGRLTEFREDLDSRSGWSSFSYSGFDDRVMPLTLLGTEYYIARDADTPFVPYGFVRVHASDRGVVYRNRHSLPLGFVYDRAIDRSRYERLAPVDRQAAMLQGAVVDDGVAPSVTRAEPIAEAVDLPYTVASEDGLRFDEAAGVIVRTKSRASLDLSFTPVPDAELYVEVRDFDNVVSSPVEALVAKQEDDPSLLGALKVLRAAVRFRQPESIRTVFSVGDAQKSEIWRTPESPYYWGNRSQLVNLGYRPQGAGRVTIAPRRKGTLTFESLNVYALPMSNYPARVARLKETALKDIRLSTNMVTAVAVTERPGIAFFSIPYGPGWSAEVDGKPAEVIRVNTGFMGIPVAAGEHRITLRYFTPGLRPGLMLALGGLMIVLGAVAWRGLYGRGRQQAGARRRDASMS